MWSKTRLIFSIFGESGVAQSKQTVFPIQSSSRLAAARIYSSFGVRRARANLKKKTEADGDFLKSQHRA